MTKSKFALAVAMFSICVFAQAVNVVSGDQAPFGLYSGAGTGKVLSTYPTFDACKAAAAALKPAAYTCLSKTSLKVTAPVVPVLTWVKVADEGGFFNVVGTQSTRYGTATKNVVKQFTDANVQCITNSYGGTDPSFGNTKECDMLLNAALPIPAPPVLSLPTPGIGGFDVTGMPKVDMSKIPAVDPAEKYTTNRIQPLSIDPATNLPANPSLFMAYQNLTDIGAFREACGYAGMNKDDAIVFPGKVGASHLHTYFGVFADANTTSDGIVNSAWSTCAGGLLNRTSYWMPTMIDTLDGTPLKPSSINVYYKGSYYFDAATDAPKIVPVPSKLHLIAGNSGNVDPRNSAATFTCLGPNGENPGAKNTISAAFSDGTCVPGGDFVMSIGFPICWDGVNLDSPDHKSHVLQPVQIKVTNADGSLSFPMVCPTGYPVRLPTVTYNVHYTIPDNKAVKRWYLSSDHYPALPGSSAHADYFFGWDAATVETFTKHCLNEQRDCHNYLLGDNLNMLY